MVIKKIYLSEKEYDSIEVLFEGAKKLSVKSDPKLFQKLEKLQENKSLWNKIKGSDRDIIRRLISSYTSFSQTLEKIKKIDVFDNYDVESKKKEVKLKPMSLQSLCKKIDSLGHDSFVLYSSQYNHNPDFDPLKINATKMGAARPKYIECKLKNGEVDIYWEAQEDSNNRAIETVKTELKRFLKEFKKAYSYADKISVALKYCSRDNQSNFKTAKFSI